MNFNVLGLCIKLFKTYKKKVMQPIVVNFFIQIFIGRKNGFVVDSKVFDALSNKSN